MTNYRRATFCGGYYFFTVVTYKRRPFLVDDLSRETKRERGIWQRRFWEHQIRDEEDLHKHVDYIHYNPVKHGLAGAVEDWPWSTYHRFVRSGFYTHRVLNDYGGDFGEDFAGE